MVNNKNILSISNLKKSYDDFLALNNINLNLNSGEYVVLLGPNGAGKSTLFSILTGMLSPDLGDCIINGYSIKSQNVNALKAIGIVFQQTTIDMELSILENLNFHARLQGLFPTKISLTISLVFVFIITTELVPSDVTYINSPFLEKLTPSGSTPTFSIVVNLF